MQRLINTVFASIKKIITYFGLKKHSMKLRESIHLFYLKIKDFGVIKTLNPFLLEHYIYE